MKILSVSCSDQLLSVSLNIDGEIRSAQIFSNRDHNHHILNFVDRLVAGAQISLQQIDAVAYGRGPGSYTGLRIAAGVAQGLGFGADVPAVAVSTMAAIAQKFSPNKVFVAIDAKKDRLFVGQYARNADGIAELVGDEQLTTIAEISLSGTNWFGAGDGWDQHAKELERRFRNQIDGWEPDQQPHANEIAILGAEYFRQNLAVEARLAVPRYLSPYFSG